MHSAHSRAARSASGRNAGCVHPRRRITGGPGDSTPHSPGNCQPGNRNITLGLSATSIVIVRALADGKAKFIPDIVFGSAVHGYSHLGADRSAPAVSWTSAKSVSSEPQPTASPHRFPGFLGMARLVARVYRRFSKTKTMRKVTAILALTITALFAGANAPAVWAQDNSPKQDIKDAGHNTKEAGKDTGDAAKGAAKKTGHAP